MKQVHIMEEMLYLQVGQMRGDVIHVEIHQEQEARGDVRQRQRFHIIWIQETG